MKKIKVPAVLIPFEQVSNSNIKAIHRKGHCRRLEVLIPFEQVSNSNLEEDRSKASELWPCLNPF